MYISYGRGEIHTDKPTQEFFYVNNCGIYKNITHKINVNRPNGRNDYQIIYVTEGNLFVETNSGLKKAEKGSLIIFEPKVKQCYYSDISHSTSYCWIHFTGTKSKEIMTSLNLKSGIYKIDDFDEFSIRCREIIDVMQKNDNLYNIKITGLALSLIGDIPKKLTPDLSNKFSNVISKMENDKPNGTKITEYASLCNLSHGHFIKLFKSEYGLSPSNYRLKLLIDKSRALLIDSDLKINEVSQKCGFDDPLYFSRIFKKFVGLSPENYRKKHR